MLSFADIMVVVGVKAAMGNSSIRNYRQLIRHIKDVYRFHQQELDAIENEKNVSINS